ncbi:MULTISPECIES: YidC family membrane integrase SpoIIIJ [unclassified Bacillus (in: firmicutes)]|uniref:YidC family membrane integrase SpoIIIJ n=1 Tax=unclassified Bacillus (in: firmicutes) TaxID=185979 RepID=UPI0008EC96CF|nr:MULTISPECIES: YidC family membrane integrase SpoIIIJ [unclassified Bacillus (in: firmicutes)]SFB01663.1 protein translocase subunit yidC [Bacillus sp. UNCCL13]SFQ89297.1 protein translocase subunit yidC [Bacillus sp. cl95]
MKKKIFLVITLISLMLLLSGCTEIKQPITSESEGFWNEYIVYPLSLLITKAAEILGGNFGLSIIFVTILIRLAILPLMIKQTKNSKAMQALQPEMQKLREKYSSKDQKTQQKLQQETMALFQQNGVNPLAGCFPLLVQMPILIGFYHAISRTREISEHSFLWFDLGDKDPYYILPIVAGITTFIQQKLMMAGTENQNPQMAMMLWMMPIMIVIFAFNFPAALSLYWVVGNLFMIVQTYLIKGPELKKASASGNAGGAKK